MNYFAFAGLVLFASSIQASIGFGLSVLIVAILPMFIPLSKALAINLGIVLFNTIYFSVKYRKTTNWQVLLPMAVPSLLITGILSFVSVSFNQKIMMLLLGCILIVLAVYSVVFSSKVKIVPTVKNGVFMGILCGICYGLFSIGGPAAALYLMPALDNKEKYFATMQTYFAMSNILSFTIRILRKSLIAADSVYIFVGWGAMLLGMLLGQFVFKKLNQNLFRKLVYVFVGLNGLWIVINNLLIV